MKFVNEMLLLVLLIFRELKQNKEERKKPKADCRYKQEKKTRILMGNILLLCNLFKM